MGSGHFVEEDSEEIDAALDQIVVDCRNDLFALLAKEWEVLFKEHSHLLDNVVNVGRNTDFLGFRLLKMIAPGVENGLPAEMDRLHIDHAASADCSRRGHSKIVDFEHHGEGGW